MINVQRMEKACLDRARRSFAAGYEAARAQARPAHSLGEFTLGELLRDPMTRALMRADGVAMDEAIALFRRARFHLLASLDETAAETA